MSANPWQLHYGAPMLKLADAIQHPTNATLRCGTRRHQLTLGNNRMQPFRNMQFLFFLAAGTLIMSAPAIAANLPMKQQYEQAQAALDTLVSTIAPGDDLPRRSNANVDALFVQMDQSIAVLGTPEFPIEQFDTFTLVCESVNKLAVRYALHGIEHLKGLGLSTEQIAGRVRQIQIANATLYQDELISLLALNMRCQALHLPWLAAFMASLPVSERTTIRLDGIRQMRQGMLATIIGGVVTLTEFSRSTENKNRMSEALTRYIDAYSAVMTLADREAGRGYLTAISSAVFPDYQATYQIVEAAFTRSACAGLCKFQ